jgi:cell division control protein 6
MLKHVRVAQSQIEADQITPVISSLPKQQKLVLAAILINEKYGLKNIETGQVQDIYSQVCEFVGQNALTQRRVRMLISNLDMLGLITARVISRGRMGRTKEINSCMPTNVNPMAIIGESEPDMLGVLEKKYRHQTRL